MQTTRNGIAIDTLDVRVLAKINPKLWSAADTRNAHKALKFLIATWDDRADRARVAKAKAKTKRNAR